MTNCNDHGDEVDGKCSCDWGWYNDTNKSVPDPLCSVPGKEIWNPKAWEAFKIIFIILHCILFLISTYKLYRTLNSDKIKNIKRLAHRLFRSPRNLCLLFIACIGFLRALWLLIDPFSFEKKTNRTGDRLLYETVYPFIYGLYSSVLLVWGGLYQGMRPKNSDPFKILRKFIMAMMILAFPISIVISVLKGYRESKVWMPIAAIFVSIGIFILLFGFIIFGVMLYCYVEKQGKITKNESLGQPNVQVSDNELSQESIQERSKTHRYSIAMPNSEYNNSRESNRSWEDFINKEIFAEDETAKENDKQESEEYEVLPKKKPIEHSKTFISLITDDDRNIFRKLCFLMMISTLLGIMVLVFIIFLTNSSKNLKPHQELYLLYGVFALEIFASMMIFFVFTAQIKVKEKNNLRFFSLISMKMNKKEPKIHLPPVLKNIKIRLKNFYS